MVSELARAAMRALTMGMLLPAIGLAGCVTASVRDENVTSMKPSGGSSATTSTYAPRRSPGVEAPDRAPALLTAYGSAAPPQGAAGLCGRYPWACSSQATGSGLSETEMLAHARKINTTVNRKIRPATDQSLYGKEEYWVLPTTAGDCEDYALLKKKLLLEAGVPANKLFIATAFNRRMEHHVVLVMRTSRGDLVLDNLTSSIRSWQATGYTYLKRQNPANKQMWEAVLLGPHASRT